MLIEPTPEKIARSPAEEGHESLERGLEIDHLKMQIEMHDDRIKELEKLLSTRRTSQSKRLTAVENHLVRLERNATQESGARRTESGRAGRLEKGLIDAVEEALEGIEAIARRFEALEKEED